MKYVRLKNVSKAIIWPKSNFLVKHAKLAKQYFKTIFVEI